MGMIWFTAKEMPSLNYKKGVTMTLDKAAKALDALHVEEIEALGKPFDPNFM